MIINCEIKKLEKSYLKGNIETFKRILYQVSYQYWTDEHFLLDLLGKWNYSYIAILDSILIGFCVCSQKKGGVLHIHKLFVDRKYHGLKIGQALIEKIKSICIANKIKKISVNVYKTNIKAIHVYKKLLGLSIETCNKDKIGERYFMSGSIEG